MPQPVAGNAETELENRKEEQLSSALSLFAATYSSLLKIWHVFPG